MGLKSWPSVNNSHDMIKITIAVLILVSSAASSYYSFVGLTKPNTLLPYSKAKMPRLGIQLLSLLLGIGGVLLLFPQTFVLGGILLILHSSITIVCYAILKDWRGGFFEFLFMQLPVFLLWVGYPLWVLDSDQKSLNERKTESHLVYIDNKAHGFEDKEEEKPVDLEIVKQKRRRRHYKNETEILRQIGKLQISTYEPDGHQLLALGPEIETIPDLGVDKTAISKVASNATDEAASNAGHIMLDYQDDYYPYAQEPIVKINNSCYEKRVDNGGTIKNKKCSKVRWLPTCRHTVEKQVHSAIYPPTTATAP
jgi:hypothetical protein